MNFKKIRESRNTTLKSTREWNMNKNEEENE